MAGQNAGGEREELEVELQNTRRQIVVKEAALNDLLPHWEEQRNLESSEKRRLDETTARLNTLFTKQGRVSKFRTRAERDAYLRSEITSMSNYQTGQASALEATKTDLEKARRSELELQSQMTEVQDKIEEGRRRAKELSEEISALKEQQMELTEKRKDSWREDTKLDSLVKRASDELRTAERALAGMMDKVCCLRIDSIYISSSGQDTGQGLRAVDNIAERYNLSGVYGPLYRLFEVVDHKYNIAAELTAGNRCAFSNQML